MQSRSQIIDFEIIKRYFYCWRALFNWKPLKGGWDTPWGQSDAPCPFDELSCFLEKPRWQGPDGILQPTVSKRLGPQSYSHKESHPSNNPNELGGRFFPSQASRCKHSSVSILTAALWDHEQNTQWSCAQTLDPKKLWDNKCVDLSHYICSNLLHSNRKLIEARGREKGKTITYRSRTIKHSQT